MPELHVSSFLSNFQTVNEPRLKCRTSKYLCLPLFLVYFFSAELCSVNLVQRDFTSIDDCLVNVEP